MLETSRRIRPTKVPRERPVLKLTYAALIRATAQWRGIKVARASSPKSHDSTQRQRAA